MCGRGCCRTGSEGGVAVTVSDFEGNLGLLFWPVLEWMGLFGVFVVWAFEGAKGKEAGE